MLHDRETATLLLAIIAGILLGGGGVLLVIYVTLHAGSHPKQSAMPSRQKPYATGNSPYLGAQGKPADTGARAGTAATRAGDAALTR